MKNILCLAFAIILLFSFTSCEKEILDDINLENSTEDLDLAVSTTIPTEYALTSNDTLPVRTTDKDLNTLQPWSNDSPTLGKLKVLPLEK